MRKGLRHSAGAFFLVVLLRELFQRLPTRRTPGGCPRYRVFSSARLVDAELPEYPLSPLVENLVERRDYDERQQRRCNHTTNHRASQRRTELRAFADS